MPKRRYPPSYQSVLLVGGSGTAKTSTVLMYTSKFAAEEVLFKQINFSSATSPYMLQKSVEAELERKTGTSVHFVIINYFFLVPHTF